jgi:RHS repeat-associated protein
LLGNGTACLVWSSSLASDLRQPMRYIDLMGGQKPHLLINSTNNMGAETEVHYAASTRFYLQDRLEGRPWVTKLPFPVHVVERIESRDLVSNTRLVSTYRYRHGYFDGVEREFRGFAYVEQRDVESVVDQFDLPPVVSKTWFHTGALLDGDKLEAYFKNPVNHEYFMGDPQAVFLPDTSLPPNLTVDEMREAARALKGSILRQEVYADDASVKAALPYSVSERSYRLTCLQAQGPNRHAVFFSHAGEAIDYHYERNPVDPRISHALTLAVDDYGNVLKSAAIGYPRRVPAYAEQGKLLATLTENQVTNAISEDDAYHAPLPAGSKSYELTSAALEGAQPLDFAAIDAIAMTAGEINYEAQPTPGLTQKRLLAEARTLYRKGDLSVLLPPGIVDSMVLPGETYKKALTPGLLSVFQGKASPAELTVLLTGPDGRYRDLDGDGELWVISGQVFYSPDAQDSAQQELAFAQAHFFLPHRFQEPFGANSIAAYDANQLLLVSVIDAIGNQVLSEHDYRVLQPKMITDPNGNRSEARFDALGMLAGTAIQGKASGPLEGDLFDDFVADLTSTQIKDFFDSANPRPLAVTHLGSATTRIVYDLERVPVCAAAIARETHVSDLAAGQVSEVQLHFAYSDGFGREAQTKVQAEPGPLDLNDPQSPMLNPRWVGTGAKVYNNKGKPVRQFEPFFSATPGFGIEQHGVSSTLFYDPMERVVATLHPNNTFEKVVFNPWMQETWDVNDTVTQADPKLDQDIGSFFQALPDSDYLPTWHEQRKNGQLGLDEKDAASKAAAHANTPTIAHLDTLGRPFLTIVDNGKDSNNLPQLYTTQVTLNIEGKQLAVTDALVRKVMTYDYDMLGSTLHQASMEAGARWMLNDAAGKPLRAWDSRGHTHRTEYDVLHRPLNSFVLGADLANPAREICFAQTIYSEASGLTAAQVLQANLRGKPYQHLDTAGRVTSIAHDFKGNLLHSNRQLVQDYKTTPDWLQNPQPILEAEVFISSTRFDALNRPIQMLAPHMVNGKMNVMRPGYNAANLLERMDVWLAQDTEPSSLLAPASANLHAVTNIDYDAKGQRTRVAYGNGAQTAYSYDPQTLRLMHLQTSRSVAPVQQSLLQDLFYHYDPVGNITHIRDSAQQPIYFNGQVVLPECDYAYDPLYRLSSASGREHIGQLAQPQTSDSDEYRVNLPQPGDGQAMRNYTEQYLYDAVGNFEKLIHQAANSNWNRSYTYNEASLNEVAKNSNRLTSTSVFGVSEPYAYDAHGNMTSMPHLTLMQWDFKDQLSASSRQVVNLAPPPNKVPETTFYVYDGSGERMRKVTERQNGTRKNERIYLGGFEVFREFKANGSDIELERETLHVMDDKQRIALVETRTQGDDGSPARLIRYQLGNHLGSASLELDDQANVISYEEYFPYGSTSYQAVDQSVKAAKKQYRYTGMERDDETGLNYHSARYYAPWLGRWTAADPGGLVDGPNLYRYSHNNPVLLADPSGYGPKGKTLWEFIGTIVIAISGLAGTHFGNGLGNTGKVAKPPKITKEEGDKEIRERDDKKITPPRGAPPDPDEKEKKKDRDWEEAQLRVYNEMRRAEFFAPKRDRSTTFSDYARALAPATFSALAREPRLQDVPAGIEHLYAPGSQDDVSAKGGNVAKKTVEIGLEVAMVQAAVGAAGMAANATEAALVEVATEKLVTETIAREMVFVSYRIAPTLLRVAPIIAGGAAPLMPRISIALAPKLVQGGDVLQKYGPSLGHNLGEAIEEVIEVGAENLKHLHPISDK